MKKFLFFILTILLIFNNLFSQNVDSLLNVFETEKNDSVKAIALYYIISSFDKTDQDTISYYEQKYLNFLIADNDLSYNDLTYFAAYFSSNEEYYYATKVYLKAVEKAEKAKDYEFVVTINNVIGYYYVFLSDFEKAFKILYNTIDFINKNNLKQYLTRNYMILGYAYRDFGDLENAKLYFQKSKDCPDNEDVYNDESAAINELGNIELMTGNYEEALKYQLEALNLRIATQDSSMLTYSYNDIAISYQNLGNIPKAIEYLNKSVEINKITQNSQILVANYSNLGKSYLDLKEYDIAKKYIDSSEVYVKQANLLQSNIDFKETLFAYYEVVGDYENAFKNCKEYIQLNDSLKNQETEKLIKELSVKYETELKDNQIIAANEKLKRKNVIIFSVLIGFGIVSVLFILLFKLFNKLKFQNAEILQKNEEIMAQSEEIELQKDFILEQNKNLESKNKHITDSILYAKRIQTAVMPAENVFSNVFNDYFILNKPRDIVSGDFYWIKKIKNIKIIAVADCTGHGVPGAFMSMLGIALLNEIVRNENITSPDLILEEMRIYLKNSLHQSEKKEGSKDGMDLALCTIDEDLNLEYSGANNPVLIVKNNEEIYLNADKQPIGVYIIEKKFNKTSVKLEKNSMLYLFSDGYRDQFGGVNGKKFQIKPFKELLFKISIENCLTQKNLLEDKFNEWINSSNINFPQLDDILIVGIRF